jgi:hypothetical protein
MVKNSINPISTRPPEVASSYLTINFHPKGDSTKEKIKIKNNLIINIYPKKKKKKKNQLNKTFWAEIKIAL